MSLNQEIEDGQIDMDYGNFARSCSLLKVYAMSA